ncbi:MAG: hypothetical protein JXA09_07285 [Anaerolineae bacterium]|nr:hypothetical protein [Anaerolineae bacterium]
MDKSATILEAQWIEKEIPRIRQELTKLKAEEQALLTTPLETVSQAYQDVYRAEMRLAVPFYRRARKMVATRYGYKERTVETGWISVLYRVLMALLALLAIYVAYHNHQLGETQRGIIWASILLVIGIVLSFAPMVAAYLWERRARHNARLAAEDARASETFLQEKQTRQAALRKCQTRIAELEGRLHDAELRYDELCEALIRGDGAA